MGRTNETLIFNGVDFVQRGWVMGVKADYPPFPEVELTTMTVDGRNGDIVTGRRYKPFDVTVTCTVVNPGETAATLAPIVDAINSALVVAPVDALDSQNGLATLVLPDGRSFKARLSGQPTLSKLSGYPTLTMVFHVSVNPAEEARWA